MTTQSILDQLPDMSLDFTDERIEIGDSLAYINKHRQWQQELEEWSRNLQLYAGALVELLNEAKTVPNDIRLALAQMVLDAQIAAQQCASAAAGLNLPPITPDNAGMVLRINPDGSGYGVVSLAGAVSDAVPDYQFVEEM